jgi:hypothetical protein
VVRFKDFCEGDGRETIRAETVEEAGSCGSESTSKEDKIEG